MRPRVNSNSLIFLVLLQGAGVVMFCNWYYELSPCDSPPADPKVHVLLLSSWRSGSSFLGQVFSQHPSVFYFMEPAWHVWSTMRTYGAKTLRMAVRDLMRSVFQCDFSVMDSYMSENRNTSSFFMWYQSRALCSPPVCSLTPFGQISNVKECQKECHGLDFEKATNSCQIYSHVVLKETRFFELESLYPLFQDPNLDLRIVHLIRDPRAVYRSREESALSFKMDNAIILEHRDVPEAEEQFQVMKKICQSHIRINETATQDPPAFLKGRYKLVRYEDVTRHPLQEISDIYDFVGLKMTKEMEDWIVTMTHGKGKGNLNNAFEVIPRNAAQVSQAWRSTLPFNKVKRIQEVCKEAMSMLRYKAVNSEEEQKRLDMDLYMPEGPKGFAWASGKLRSH
ncbi:carbohydrate sulfotransferase 6-like [Xiphophorus maculatus]|uniref:Sulfotransferase n=1 Tax=Xiphophorus maculatus TaxID=8083 RepID=M4ANQ6_XIPMA|nr:carbohydrate sulfotransferase 6-like [Xiphophorus maculatus]XP_023198399.1 carbohydrate sulfotransferase 6-like [Xiphophorus maculatus]